MLTIKQGNLLDSDSKFIAHCANVHCTMGAGIALALANKWPEVAAADKTTEHTAICNKYGRYSRADLPDGRAVYNLYAQVGVGNDGTPLNRNAKYDLLFDTLYRASQDAQIILDQDGQERGTMGLPWLCAGLAGGRRSIVRAIVGEIDLLFENIDYTIYEL